MNNLILFTNTFLSYLLVFIVMTVVVVLAIMIGISMRKRKNESEQMDKEVKTLENREQS